MCYAVGVGGQMAGRTEGYVHRALSGLPDAASLFIEILSNEKPESGLTKKPKL